MNSTNSLLVNLRWSMIEAQSGLKNLEQDLFKLSQEKHFHLTFEDKLAIQDFIKQQRDLLKAVETFVD